MASEECDPLVAARDDEPAPLSAFTRVAPSPRRRRDSAWGVALLALVIFVFASGIGIAIPKSNPHDLLRVLGDPDWAADPRNCPSSSADLVAVSSSSLLSSSSSPSSDDDDADDRAARLLRASSLLLPLTLAASLSGGAAALAAFRRAPLTMAKLAIGAQIALPAFACFLAAVNGFGGPALAFALVAALTAAVFYVWRDRVELCARLLALASASLAETPALVAVSLASDAAALAVAGGLSVFAAAAVANGKVVRIAGVSSSSSSSGAPPPPPAAACAWQPAAYAPPLAALSSLAALWASLTLAQVKTFVVAGAVSAWYFGNGTSSSSSSSPLRLSLRAALGPQFGSLSLAGLVLTGTQLLRAAVDALQNAAATSSSNEESLAAGCFQLLASVLAALARGALAFLDYLTKFAVVAAAVSGRGLLASGRAATGVLRSAMLDAFGVWYFPPLLLSSWTAAAGLVWGGATGLVYHRVGGGGGNGSGTSHGHGGGSSAPQLQWQESAAVGAVCGLLAWAALSAVASVLLSAVDALFFCYAADRARGAEEAAAGGEGGLGLGGGGQGGFKTRAEVHEVLDRVPCGVVVQQPDGGVSYGAPVGGGGGVKKHVPPGEMFSRGV